MTTIDYEARARLLPGDLYEQWLERASIAEFDGGLPREEAERRAYEAVVLRRAGVAADSLRAGQP